MILQIGQMGLSSLSSLANGMLAQIPALQSQSPTEWRDKYLQSMKSHFNTVDPRLLFNFIISVTCIAAIFIAAKLLSAIQKKRQVEKTRSRPYKLLVKTQAALGLPWRDRWLLWWLSRTLNLPHPTALLISPAFFDRAIERYNPSRRRRAHWAAIRKRIFGSDS